MTTLRTIYDGSLTSSKIAVSETFTNGQFLLFDCPDFGSDEGIDIGFILTMQVSSISLSGIRTMEKDITLPSQEFQRTLTTFSIIDIPREYSESGYPLQCAFNSSINVGKFICYAVISDVTQESLSEQINSLQSDINQLKLSVANVELQVSQINAQLQVIFNLIQVLVGGLVPV